MIVLCYFIVCVNLLYCFELVETFSSTETYDVRNDEQGFSLDSLTAETQEDFLANITSPYWNLTYNKQLDIKQNHCHDIVDMIEKRCENINVPKTCKLLQIVPSPVTKAYRNIDEFHIGFGIDGHPKTVGIRIGKLSLGRTLTVHPTKVVTIKESHKRVAQIFENFVRLSREPACPEINDCGHWRTLLVRSNEAGDVMACVIVQPRLYTMKTIQEQQKLLKEYFLKHLPNITLFQQQCIYLRCTHEEAPFILLYGKPYLKETLNGYKFKITPDTFFPINKLGAEVMTDTIIKTAKLKPNTTLLDIYSGAGTIIFMASKFVKEAIGIDSITKKAIDSMYRVEINNINNIKLMLGDVEKKLKSVLERLNSSTDIVAIVNSGDTRPGLEVIRTIRNSPQISRLVYISGRPDSPNDVNNFVALCSKKTSKARPFRLTKAIPVDLLPQTEHVELILMFQR